MFRMNLFAIKSHLASQRVRPVDPSLPEGPESAQSQGPEGAPLSSSAIETIASLCIASSSTMSARASLASRLMDGSGCCRHAILHSACTHKGVFLTLFQPSSHFWAHADSKQLILDVPSQPLINLKLPASPHDGQMSLCDSFLRALVRIKIALLRMMPIRAIFRGT